VALSSPRDTSRGTERRRGFSLAEQLRVLAPLIAVWGVGFSILVAVALRGRPGELLLDPVFASGGSWYFGAVAQFGVLAWSVAAVLCAGAGWLVPRLGRGSAGPFLLSAAVVGSILLIDDLFALHATVIGKLIGKPLGMAVVVGPSLWWAVRFRHDVMRTRWQVLVCAVVGLGVSAVVDVVWSPERADYSVLIEDGAKFLGVLAWMTYAVLTVRDIVESALSDRRAYGPAGVSYGEAQPPFIDSHNATTPAANASTSAAEVSQLHTQRT
jgi:hypothetical protein